MNLWADSSLAADFPSGITVREARARIGALLRQGGIEEAFVEADILLGWLLDCDRAGLILAAGSKIDNSLRRRLLTSLRRRLGREPLAYIIGEWEFWSLSFAVGPEVLIPRPETELLVEQALAFARPGSELPVEARKQAPEKPLRILDLGTGSGILAVVLARELAAARVVALDLSAAALAVARANALRHGVAARISLVCSHWLTALRARPLFDLVVANPPYVVRGELANLQPEVRDFEPRTALDGGERGLDDIDELCRTLPPFMRAGALLLMEIGWDQQETVQRLFRANPAFSEVEILPDLAGHPRIIRCRRCQGTNMTNLRKPVGDHG